MSKKYHHGGRESPSGCSLPECHSESDHSKKEEYSSYSSSSSSSKSSKHHGHSNCDAPPYVLHDGDCFVTITGPPGPRGPQGPEGTFNPDSVSPGVWNQEKIAYVKLPVAIGTNFSLDATVRTTIVFPSATLGDNVVILPIPYPPRIVTPTSQYSTVLNIVNAGAKSIIIKTPSRDYSIHTIGKDSMTLCAGESVTLQAFNTIWYIIKK